mmetsp:Transcript_2446/g.3738  ORF Transcript_2446/g.3738 Transcript_2446/m.3738 type:complete len:185 (+) Transcript_2446:28-582(+)|eukprot:CAMPEP_0196143534 /NCGR_PEP_ID=MMETSP0910-20130528/13566_1 /TAXON_ID=49265 /ORGANISM="Thalassiosira rotula, Strain GSO102" /LENGTH=184 /DNA_ID=CAMNT_0041405007 /DNA_START=59 /DNA_END=613 /DNA_ORIENTATION=+
MANTLRKSPSIFAAAIVVLIQAPAISGWIPRIQLLTSSRLRLRGGGDAAGSQRERVSLSARNENDENIRKIDDEPEQPDNHEPLFAEGELFGYISRLEAIMDSEFYVDNTDEKSQQRLLEGGDRVVLGDWMDWDEGLCVGDSCGDEFDQCDIPEEYKVTAPKVDVMSFLGIRRAEPLQVQRDFQ